MAALPPLAPEEGRLLLEIAARAIAAVARGERAPGPDLDRVPPALREPRATFVTLRRGGELRGCRGTITAAEPLAASVARSACASAFDDERFPPVVAEELQDLELHVSVLSTPEPMEAATEEALLAALRPGRDGLILHDGPRLGLFLPSMWEQLPDPRTFVAFVLRKAGLPTDRWPSSIRAERFEVVEVHGRLADHLSLFPGPRG